MVGGSPTPAGALEVLDVNAVRRWRSWSAPSSPPVAPRSMRSTSSPVPDGDTGTNLFITVDAAIDRTLSQRSGEPPPEGVGELVRTFAGNLLWTARGNSGSS